MSDRVPVPHYRLHPDTTLEVIDVIAAKLSPSEWRKFCWASALQYAFRMLDKGEPDDKILAVPADDPYYHDVFDIADLSPHYLKEVEHFFLIYKDLEGKRMEITGWRKSAEAMAIIRDSLERYDRAFSTR